MQFTSITLLATALLAFSVSAAPAADANPMPEITVPEDVSAEHYFEDGTALQKRGYGCKVIGKDDVGICNFHCVNKVIFYCANGKQLRPYKGVCGGFASATCQCVYKTKC